MCQYHNCERVRETERERGRGRERARERARKRERGRERENSMSEHVHIKLVPLYDSLHWVVWLHNMANVLYHLQINR